MKERPASGEPVLAEVGRPFILSLGVAGYCSVSRPRQRSFALVATAALCISACASVPLGRGADALSAQESDVVAALLDQEGRHLEKARPILVLSPTDPWVPEDYEPGDRPTDIPAEVWAQLRRIIPTELRDANQVTRSLKGVPLPRGVQLYSRAVFEAEYRDADRFAALVRRLGGVEPLVLSVSRPALSRADGKHFVVLHVQSTWSGCGGVNLFAVESTASGWNVELKDVMVVW